jgi:YidC/Oxa1 family membrane protein insertase
LAEIRNPQQEPGGERKLLIIFVLTFLMIVIGQTVFFKNIKKPQENKQSQANSQAAATTNAPPPVAMVAPAATESKAAPTQAAAETETTVENNVYKIVFTNRGGQVKSWILKQYKDDKGQPLELVNQTAAAQFGYPLSFFTYDQGLTSKLNGAMYVASATGNVAVPGELTFEFSDGDVTAKKTLRFTDKYVIGVESSVVRGGSYVTAYPAWPSGFGDDTQPTSYALQGTARENGGDVERVASKKVVGGATINGPFNWAGAQDQYFAALFLPDNPQQSTLVSLHSTLRIPENAEKPDPNKTTQVDVVGAAVGVPNGPTVERLFVGPKALHILETVKTNSAPGQMNGPDLAKVVDFGKYLGFIAKPLFLWLRWTHDHWMPTFNGWGWSIIILTVIINAVLLPLRLSSMRSALKMQKIQPQMKALQEKYKKYKMNDPKRAEMNTEMAALYKEHGVNPVGGCLPLVIQMPFLIAFYGMLAVAIELRQAHWFWLHDLSAPDSLYVIPVLILASTFAMQRLTPQAGMDQTQAKMMMYMMPLFLFWISLRYASGLGLYWIVGNIIGFLQQMIINRTELGQEMTALRAKQAQKRALKGK